MKEKYHVAIGIALALCISAGLGSMWVFTDIYKEVQSNIVEVICLSCLKLNPKTSTNFTFETANGQAHPDFVLENLSTGPIFLHYSEDDCPSCDVMFPVIKQFLAVEPQKDKSHYTITNFSNSSVPYVYIYLDDRGTSEEWLSSFDVYDKGHVGGLPMFTVVTLGYEHSGEVKPYYATLYGVFEENSDQAIQVLTELMQEAFDMYNENKAGYDHHH